MKSRLIWEDQGERTFGLELETGEDVLTSLARFAADAGVGCASLTGVAGLQRAELGIFDLRRQTFRTVFIRRPCEALSLHGDIDLDGSARPRVHLQAVMDVVGGATRGGHLLNAVVGTSLEAILVESPPRRRRIERPDIGVTLVRVA